jgi:hypothetical protein
MSFQASSGDRASNSAWVGVDIMISR